MMCDKRLFREKNMNINKTVLSNGLTVASDNISNFGTVSIGIFVNVGGVNEDEKNTGISHFVEHMAFKGTKKRSALEISEAIENVGGYINAYTGKEVTAFHVKLLKEDAKLAVDVISDIVQNSTFEEKEFEKERGVIIQEIKQFEDTPDDLVFDLFQGKCFENMSLGQPILGTEKNIVSFKNTHLKDYLKNNYSTSKIVLCASGNIQHEELVDLAEKHTSEMKFFETKSPETQKYSGGFAHKHKDLEQNHIIIGYEGLSHHSNDRYAANVLSVILGVGMSSRLFKKIREERGLVYSIFSYLSNYSDTGTFGIYSACDMNKSVEVAKLIKEELFTISQSIDDFEMQRAKTQIKTSMLMGLESSSARMERLASQFLIHKRFVTHEEIIQKINSVTKEDIVSFMNKMLNSKATVALVGKNSKPESIYEIFV